MKAYRLPLSLEDAASVVPPCDVGRVSELRTIVADSATALLLLAHTRDETISMVGRVALLVACHAVRHVAAQMKTNLLPGRSLCLEGVLRAAFTAALDDFLGSFDDGAMVAPTAAQRDVWRRSCALCDRLVCAVLSDFACGVSHHSAPSGIEAPTWDEAVADSSSLIDMQRYVTLRCILQANQHATYTVNPFFALYAYICAPASGVASNSTESSRHNDGDTQLADARRWLMGRNSQAANHGASALVVDPVTVVTTDILTETSGASYNAAFTELSRVVGAVPFAHLNAHGAALFALASRFNHSCDPTVRVHTAPTHPGVWARAVVTAQGGVAAGDEVRISYLDARDTGRRPQTEAKDGAACESQVPSYSSDKWLRFVSRRQAAHVKLKERYGFTCDCSPDVTLAVQ
jgi:hypothetical protein